MDFGTDLQAGLAQQPFQDQNAQISVYKRLFFNFLDGNILAKVIPYKFIPECSGEFFIHVIKFHLHFFRNLSSLAVDNAHIKPRRSRAELAKVNQVLMPIFGKDDVAMMQVAMNSRRGIRQAIDKAF